MGMSSCINTAVQSHSIAPYSFRYFISTAGAFLFLLFNKICNTFFITGSFLDVFVFLTKNYIILGAAALNFNLI